MEEKAAAERQSGPTGWQLACVFVVLAFVLAGGGYRYYRREAAALQQAGVRNLSTVAALKAGQIVRWRGDARTDATRDATSPFFAEAVARWLANPSDLDLAARLRQRLSADLEEGDFANSLLVGLDGSILLAADGTPGPLGAAARQALEQAVSKRKTVLSDLHLTASGHSCLDSVAPVPGEDGRPIALLLLRSNADESLLPIVQSRTRSNASAETYLVRSSGGQVVFLTALRDRPDAALSLRVPLTRKNMPAVQAVSGRTGMWEGVDYRGKRVMADLRPIPGSDWSMVTKVDANEILAVARTRAWTIATFTGLLILVVGAGTAYIDRRRQSQLYRSLYEIEKGRREAQEALRKGEERFRKTLDDLMEGCQIIGFDWRYVYVNPAAAEQGRASKEELLGRTMMETYPGIEETEAFAALRRCMQERTPAQVENEFAYGEGESRWFDLRVQPVPQGLFILSLDITDRKLSQQRLQETMAELERSNQELQQFAYVASHDLQEPLRMVASYTQLLSERYEDKLDQDAQDFIRYAVDGANRMQTLIRDLLAYSRVTTRGREPEPVDAGEALGEALENLQIAVREADAIVSSDDLPVVLADKSQLVSLFQNLISNAIKFRRNGCPPRAHVQAQTDGPDCTFSVKDNGIGIDPKYFDRIFTIFQRLHGREEYDGTGIGLAVCKRIVERHGGRIWVESTPGAGTAFRFTLRMAPTKGAAQ